MATKNPIIQKAREHFSSIPVKEIKVPEWGDEDGNPLVIYSHPFTLFEKIKLRDLAKNDEQMLLAYVLIHKALDSDGAKIFTVADKHALMNQVDFEVVIRVAYEIMAAPTVEDMGKK